MLRVRSGPVPVSRRSFGGSAMQYYNSGKENRNAPVILLVDDDGEILETTARFLASQGIDVVASRHGAEGLALTEKWRFDAVVLDVVLPGVGGVGVARELHLIRPRLPIIMVTGHVELFRDARLHMLGICRVFSKPFRMADLTAAILDVITEAGRSGKETGPARGGADSQVWRRKRRQQVEGRAASRDSRRSDAQVH